MKQIVYKNKRLNKILTDFVIIILIAIMLIGCSSKEKDDNNHRKAIEIQHNITVEMIPKIVSCISKLNKGDWKESLSYRGAFEAEYIDEELGIKRIAYYFPQSFLTEHEIEANDKNVFLTSMLATYWNGCGYKWTIDEVVEEIKKEEYLNSLDADLSIFPIE